MNKKRTAIIIIVLGIIFGGVVFYSLGFLLYPWRMRLNQVTTWAYQIQGLDEDDAIEALSASVYDLLVIDPMRSDKEYFDFDTAGLVMTLHETALDRQQARLVVAYIDIGEAEEWRWYWDDSWIPPTKTSPGDPDFLISPDPDGWSGNYPVAFWDSRWKDIMIYNENSSIQQILDDGFDGVYLDWVDAYDFEPVIMAAEDEGLDPQIAMIDFIEEIRTYCLAQNQNFVLIQQNALDIHLGHDEYFALIDGVAQEHVLFDGMADTEWGDPDSGDYRIPASGEEGYSTAWYVERLDLYKAHGIPVFVVDYALDEDNIAESYQFAAEHGYIGFVSQTPLSQLPEYNPPLSIFVNNINSFILIHLGHENRPIVLKQNWLFYRS